MLQVGCEHFVLDAFLLDAQPGIPMRGVSIQHDEAGAKGGVGRHQSFSSTVVQPSSVLVAACATIGQC
eukprot:1966122-Rhodomonas_salina.1